MYVCIQNARMNLDDDVLVVLPVRDDDPDGRHLVRAVELHRGAVFLFLMGGWVEWTAGRHHANNNTTTPRTHRMEFLRSSRRM